MALQEIDFAQEIKNAAPDVATIESGRGNMELQGADVSDTYSNIIMSRQQGLIEKLLPKGAENAVPAPTLLKLTGLSETRCLTRMIQEERNAGAVILSTPDRRCPGFYIPDDGKKSKREIAEYMRSMISRATKILRSVHAACAALEILEGQQEIEEIENEQL